MLQGDNSLQITWQHVTHVGLFLFWHFHSHFPSSPVPFFEIKVELSLVFSKFFAKGQTLACFKRTSQVLRAYNVNSLLLYTNP